MSTLLHLTIPSYSAPLPTHSFLGSSNRPAPDTAITVTAEDNGDSLADSVQRGKLELQNVRLASEYAALLPAFQRKPFLQEFSAFFSNVHTAGQVCKLLLCDPVSISVLGLYMFLTKALPSHAPSELRLFVFGIDYNNLLFITLSGVSVSADPSAGRHRRRHAAARALCRHAAARALCGSRA